MNLIRCSSQCIYQQDGLCTLENPEQVTGKSEGCCYYIAKPSRWSVQNKNDAPKSD